MSQVFTATSTPNNGPQSTQVLEDRLILVRVVLDMLLFWGGALLGVAMVAASTGLFPLDWYSVRYLWAVVALFCSALIVGLTCKQVSRSSRNVTSALLAMVLLSFASLEFLLTWLDPVFYLFELQMFIMAFATWALVCLGLICVETRMENRLPKPTRLKADFALKTMCFRAMGFVVFGFGLLVLLLYPFYAGPAYVEQFASGWWPVTEATLIEPADSSEKRLNYTYTVGGEDYSGTREVAFFNEKCRFSVYGNPEQRLAELKLQEVFPVAYNPSHPEQSVLEPGISNLMLLSIWASAIYILLLPVALRVTTGVYRGEFSSEREATRFGAICGTMALTGVALGFAWWGLSAWVPWHVDWASILLVVGIGVIYFLDKNRAKKIQACGGLQAAS